MFYLVIIFTFTLIILFRIIQHFSVSNFWGGMFKKTGVFVLPQDFSAVTVLEVLWTFVPMVILFAIAYPSISLIYKIDTLLEPLITVKIIGHQWYWSYETNDVINLNNEAADQSLKQFFFDAYMVPTSDLQLGDFRLLDTTEVLFLPLDSDVRLLITSTDVLHSWAVPSLGLKVDAIPGRLNQAVTNIFRPGIFYGQCSEICGINHGFMPIKIISTDLETYKMKTAFFAA